jgi:hypothetical protein
VREPREVREKLDADSKMAGMTLNTLLSQILMKHTEWDRFANDVGFTSITKAFLCSLLEIIDDKDVSTIAVTTCRVQ